MLHELLRTAADTAPAGNGIRDDHRRWSYPELVERAERLAGGLMARGIGPGDAVAILLPNGPDLFVLCHALFAVGAVAMPLSLTATRDEIVLGGRKARARGLVALAQAVPVARAAAEALGPIPVIEVGDDGFAGISATRAPALPQVGGDAAALYLLSSGSTGRPKIVPHTQAELLADARRTSGAWAFTPDDVVFDMLPGNFAMGLLLGLTNAVAVGASTVYWHDPMPLMLSRQRLLETLVRERVTAMGAVPAMYESLAGARGDFDLAAMRVAFSGGAALKRATFELVRERLGITLRQAYGSTEAIMVAHNDAADPDATWDSVGRPAGDAEVRVAPGGTELGPDVGELLVRSSSTMRGYLDEPELSAAAFADGWLRSGDLARLDDQGRIYIKGRSKLLIEVSGFKIDPIEVEDALVAHPDVAEAVVIGVRDTRRGEQRLKAVVVRSGSVSDDLLLRFLRARLSVHKVPAVIEFRDALPKSSAGKVLRSQLAEET